MALTIYGAVAGSSYNGGTNTTTVNYAWDSGSLANEALTISLGQVPVTGSAVPPDAIANIEGTLASAATTDLGSVKFSRLAVTGTTTITSFGSGANLMRIVRFSGALTLTHNAASLVLLGGASRSTAAGDVGIYASDGSGNWRELVYSKASGAPVLTPLATQQVLTSGTNATYTTPAGARQLRIRMVGGGGGGGGSGAGDGGNGGNGADTIFNNVHAKGGSGATGTANFGGTGGSGGTGTANLRVPGQQGGFAAPPASGFNAVGGSGGVSLLGPSGVGQYGGVGNSASANTGAGGGGAGSTSPDVPGGGGGSGEFVELIINSPAASYTYTVGTGGSGGMT